MLKKTFDRFEQENVIDLYINLKFSIKKISKILHTGDRLIKEYLIEKGVYKSPDKYKYNINLAIQMYKNGKTLQLIGDILGVYRTTLSKHFKELGINVCRKDIMNDLYGYIFDSIDTEEKAYWLGFIYADGYISNSKKVFAINLSIKDVDHLKKLKTFINYTHDLIIDDILCRMSVTNKHLWETLNSYGCTPKKSLTLEFPNENIFKDKSLIRHFIRGYVDGDGCLTYSNSNHTIALVNILGTEKFLSKLQSYLPCNIQNLRIKHKDGSPECKIFQVTNKQARNVAKYLYNNSTIYLQRKYDRYLEFCRLDKKLSRVLTDKIGESCDANPEVTIEIKKSIAP